MLFKKIAFFSSVRLYCLKTSTECLKSVKPKITKKPAKTILNYFQTSEFFNNIKDSIPTELLSIKSCNLEYMYLIDENIANDVASVILKDIENVEETIILESFPGFGLLTENFLKNDKYDNGRINLFKSTIYSIDSLMCNDERLNKSMEIYKRTWKEKSSIAVVGAFSGYSFLRYILKCLYEQTSFNIYGRPQFYILLTPIAYNHIFFNKFYSKYNQKLTNIYTMLKLSMDVKYLADYERKGFIPWEKQSEKLTKFFDFNKLYLVKLTPKPDLFDTLPISTMRYFPYFMNCIKTRNTKIIPFFEQNIPNCGPRLIAFPKNRIDIFTTFKDLQPDKIMEIFLYFTHWPEFTECAFYNNFEEH